MKKKGSYLLILLVVTVLAAGMFWANEARADSAVTLLSPAGGECWKPGEVHTISWTTDPTGGSVNIYYSTDGGINWNKINSVFLSNTGSYNWTVPDVETNHAKIKVERVFLLPPPGTTESTASSEFTITEGYFGETKILSPNGGEHWNSGILQETREITWTSTPSGGSITLYYSTDSGNTWNYITSCSNTGSYTWAVPNINTGNARIQIRRQFSFTPPLYKYDTSDADFTIGTGIIITPLPLEPIEVIPIIFIPAIPSGLDAQAVSENNIELTWTDNSSNEDGFKIERSTDESIFSEIATVGADITEYLDTDVAPDTEYTYRIRSYNNFGDSNYSNETTAVTPAAAPGNQTGTEIEMIFYIDSAEYYVSDPASTTSQLLTMDAAPVIRENRTLLPIRYVAQHLGASVDWDPTDRKVTVATADKTIVLWIDNNTAQVNGINTQIDPANSNVVPIIIPPGRTMLPLRFITENLGCQVQWDPVTRGVTILYQE
ncbi:stalk domain-containing protein [Phosphitispora sp. TUW77]|uniref:stalk domain-containing protein n=1 Tax=Phosphitispora sp. TUW77 TaxID=3152361 RepID=UPI003AB2052F